jgi:4-amino-4-deoxy-L-arabinose transferase-like glycosyltransferase
MSIQVESPAVGVVDAACNASSNADAPTAVERARPVGLAVDRPLPVLSTESTRSQWIWLIIAALVVAWYGYKTLSYWAPADGGVDQNAYLLGGRMIAEHFSTRYTLPSPYAYVGGMMMRVSKADVPGGDYYPKYPLGLPLLYASFFWIFGATKAATLAFLVSPISSIMAVAGMFFLARLLAGSFAGLMAAILLGTSQLTIELSNNPNSHASCMAFIVWGIYFLLKWWQSKAGFAGSLLGILGGFLIGYAGLIRYSEGLLILPIAVASLSRLPWNTFKTYRSISVPIAFVVAAVLIIMQVDASHLTAGSTEAAWTTLHKSLNATAIVSLIAVGIAALVFSIRENDSRDWLQYFRNAIPGLAWAVPIAVMLIFNKHSMGNWTGYDSTNESEGFTWLKFTQTWEQMLRTYYDTAAFFVFPLGLAGLFMVFGRSWKLGLMLLAWLLPGSALYTSYYWSPDNGISYARFFLAFTPAIMLGAAVCFSDAILLPVRSSAWPLKIPRFAAILLVVGIAASLGVYRSVHGLQQGLGGGMNRGNQSIAQQQHVRQNLAQIGQVLLRHVPVDSVLFTDNQAGGGGGGGGNERPLNYIQFLRHWDTYSTDAFDVGGPRGMMGRLNGLANNLGFGANNNDPNPVPTTRQQLQVDYTNWLYSGKSMTQLRKDQAKIIDAALQARHGVFALTTVANDRDTRRFFNLVGKYKIDTVETWNDLPPLPPDPVAENPGNTNGRNRGGNFFGGGGGPGGGGGGRNNGRRGGGGGGGFNNPAATGTESTGIHWELLEVKPAS